jgi:cytochrome c oxidase assembly protein subunit 15
LEYSERTAPEATLTPLPKISPSLYARITTVTLVLLAAIVFTGAAVRLTGSGLGCPTWPECHGKIIQTHLDSPAAIEYGNRLVTGLVGAGAILAFLGAFLRRPFRRDLAIIGGLMPLGVLGQALLGGFSVLYGLAPGWVMAHFLLSMVILAGAIALAWRAHHEPATKPANDRNVVLATRGLLVLNAWVLVLGTLATAAGPHPGASKTGEVVSRLHFKGGETLTWMIHWHGRFSTFFGLCAVATWLYARRRRATAQTRRALTALCLLLATQGVVGFVQYETGLPAGVVWVHVALATLTWLTVNWSVAAAGRLAPLPAADLADDRRLASGAGRAA